MQCRYGHTSKNFFIGIQFLLFFHTYNIACLQHSTSNGLTWQNLSSPFGKCHLAASQCVAKWQWNCVQSIELWAVSFPFGTSSVIVMETGLRNSIASSLSTTAIRRRYSIPGRSTRISNMSAYPSEPVSWSSNKAEEAQCTGRSVIIQTQSTERIAIIFLHCESTLNVWEYLLTRSPYGTLHETRITLHFSETLVYSNSESLSSAVGIATRLRNGRPSGRSSGPGRVKNLHSTILSRLALRPTQPPIQCVSRDLSPGIKRQRREADHSPPTSDEVKRTWINTFAPQYVCMA
jgi:hypothetical protein